MCTIELKDMRMFMKNILILKLSSFKSWGKKEASSIDLSF